MANFDLVMNEASRREIERTFDDDVLMPNISEIVDLVRRTDTFERLSAVDDAVHQPIGFLSRLVINGTCEYTDGVWSKDRLLFRGKLVSFGGADHASTSSVSRREKPGRKR